jgi:hypothetical protein
MDIKMITCEEAAKLISESMDHTPPFFERMNLKMHLLMCKACPTYMRQLHLIREFVKNWASNAGRFLTDKNLSRESKIKIKNHLRQIKSGS